MGVALAKLDISLLIHGDAPGADTLAGLYAADHGIDCVAFPANWERHGPAAGPMRNQRMLEVAKPELVIAFPGGKGTADMVRRARKAGVPVNEITPIADSSPPSGQVEG